MSAFYPPKLPSIPSPAVAFGSTSDDLLRDSDPAWIGRLRLGITFTLWGLIVSVLGLAATIYTFSARLNPEWIVWIPISITVAGCFMSAAGSWLLTSPDPSGRGENRYRNSRRFVRVVTVMLAIYSVLMCIGREINLPGWAAIVLAISGEFLGSASFIVNLRYLSRLALRIRDTFLSERSKLLMYGFAVCLGVPLLAVNGVFLASPFYSELSDVVVGMLQITSLLAGIGCLVLLIMYIVMLENFGKRFKQQETLARQSRAAK